MVQWLTEPESKCGPRPRLAAAVHRSVFLIMRAVILQPTYLPWIGYFGMVDLADTFVFYDDVQFVQRSWQRRNKIRMHNRGAIWLSVPVRSEFGQNINEVRINTEIGWRDKHWTTIMHAYGRAPFFKEYASALEEIFNREWEYLVDLNITLIQALSRMLGIQDTVFLKSSELDVKGQKTDRLVNVLTKIGADEYISGPAAKSYIETNKFKDHNITLCWHDFTHPTYPQLSGDFVPYLSVIDLLFNVGENSLKVIRAAEKDSLKKQEFIK